MEKNIFDMTKNFAAPEILNKYRNTDKNIDNRIRQDEIKKEKYENLDRIINKNIDKIIEKNMENKEITSDEYDNEYNFDNDANTLNSFSKVFMEHEIEHVPRINTKFLGLDIF